MRIEDLAQGELLELDTESGVIKFAGHRALIFDASAMGLLRKCLVRNLGFTAARAILTQFGFAHGWQMAEAVEELDWDCKEEWQRAGARLQALAGLFLINQPGSDPRSIEGTTIGSSYEAEQHTQHFGRSDVPVCWTTCGLMSGYLSRTSDSEIFVLEDHCAGRGDSACHLLGRTREVWGPVRAAELRFFDRGFLIESLDASLRHATEALRAAEEKLRAHRQGPCTRPVSSEGLGIVVNSPEMKRVVDLARRVARVDSTVIITGESGCGKERIARLIHDASPRADGPFVAVSCGAIPETLLESELFGHSRGAFTGATQDHAGLFEAANSGTLLLDEIGEVSPAMQIKLLRVLQEPEIRRVGETKSRRINVRVIAATNRDLAEAVRAGTFRLDLYYRLKVVGLHVPPLRERRSDILPLARLLLSEASVRLGREVKDLSTRAADQLLRYHWPGNVRELENTMERAVVLARSSSVDLEDLPEDVRMASPWPVGSGGTARPLEEIEKEHILASLKLNDGNQTRTAKQLRIGSATLYRKLKSYGVIRDKRSAQKDAPVR